MVTRTFIFSNFHYFRQKVVLCITPLKISTFEELKWHACHFILSKCYPFTDLEKALRAVSNLQWCQSAQNVRLKSVNG